MQTKSRQVMPQWPGEEGHRNLGKHNPATREFDTEDEVVAVLKKYPDAFLELLNGACHIKFSGPALADEVKAELEVAGDVMGKTEKLEAWATKVHAKAKVIAERVVKDGFVLDFAKLFPKWAENRRGLKVDPEVIKLIEEKWAASTKKEFFLAKYGLDPSLVDKDTQTVVEAYKARQRVKSTEDL